MKTASAKIDAEEALNKSVRGGTAREMMEKAHRLMSEPNTCLELCATMSLQCVSRVRAWVDEEQERNGPAFYIKLAQFFIEGYLDFKTTFDQWSIAKSAVEKSWLYRSHVLFTSPEGALSREGIKSALDQREEELRKEPQRLMNTRHARTIPML